MKHVDGLCAYAVYALGIAMVFVSAEVHGKKGVDRAEVLRVFRGYLAGPEMARELRGERIPADTKWHIATGDINGDGYVDAVVNLTFVPVDGNAFWHLGVAVLLNSGGRLRFAGRFEAPKRDYRDSAQLRSIEAGRVTLVETRYRNGDADCCPSLGGVQAYVYRNGTLVPDDGRKKAMSSGIRTGRDGDTVKSLEDRETIRMRCFGRAMARGPEFWGRKANSMVAYALRNNKHTAGFVWGGMDVSRIRHEGIEKAVVWLTVRALNRAGSGLSANKLGCTMHKSSGGWKIVHRPDPSRGY